ncbi:Uncharacterised protein [Bacteroides xylanisolvens]|nr:Uncharacterised protein [Bacteroides xylanisolvens]
MIVSYVSWQDPPSEKMGHAEDRLLFQKRVQDPYSVSIIQEIFPSDPVTSDRVRRAGKNFFEGMRDWGLVAKRHSDIARWMLRSVSALCAMPHVSLLSVI